MQKAKKPPKSLYEQTTVEVAREAARVINEYMSHWNDRIPEATRKLIPNSPFHGAKVTRLERLLATPEYQEPGQTSALWLAHFDRDIPALCFEICNGRVGYASARSFYADDLREVETPPAQSQAQQKETQRIPLRQVSQDSHVTSMRTSMSDF